MDHSPKKVGRPGSNILQLLLFLTLVPAGFCFVLYVYVYWGIVRAIVAGFLVLLVVPMLIQGVSNDAAVLFGTPPKRTDDPDLHN